MRPEHHYYISRDIVIRENTKRLHKIAKCEPYIRSLNSGLFLGERVFLIETLTKMVEYMNEDSTKGFPYGEIENQKLWQYIQYIYENGEIQIDYLSTFFLWTHCRKFDFPADSWEHFNFFNKLQLNKDMINEK
jgi:hypothetical protein